MTPHPRLESPNENVDDNPQKSDWIAQEISQIRLIPQAFIKKMWQAPLVKKSILTPEPTKEAVVIAMPVETPVGGPEEVDEFSFESLKREESANDVLRKWKEEVDDKDNMHRQKMSQRPLGEKLSTLGREIRDGLAQFLPGASSRSINKVLKAQGVTEEADLMQQPTLKERVSQKVSNLRKGWKGFVSIFSLGAGLNQELDTSLREGEISPEEYKVLRQPTLKEKISLAPPLIAKMVVDELKPEQDPENFFPAEEWKADARRVREEWKAERDYEDILHREKMRKRPLKEKLSSFGRDIVDGLARLLPYGASRSINRNLKAQGMSDEAYESMRQPMFIESVSSQFPSIHPKGNVATDFPSANDRHTPRKKWQRVVGAITVGAALLASYVGYKKFSHSERQDIASAPASSMTFPKVPTSAEMTSPSPLFVEPNIPEPASEKDSKIAFVPQKPRLARKVLPKVQHQPIHRSEKRGLSRQVPTNKPLQASRDGDVKGQKVHPKNRMVTSESRKTITSLQSYLGGLQTEWGRIQDIEKRMKFVYGRHSSAQFSQTLASLLHVMPVQKNTKTYIQCSVECGTDEQRKVVELLNQARGLLGEGQFQKDDSPATVSKKTSTGKKQVLSARKKINDAVRRFSGNEKAARRTYVANRVAYSEINKSNAQEKLEYVEKKLAKMGISTDGRISLKIPQKKHTVRQKRSIYSVKVVGAAKVFDFTDLQSQLSRADADLQECDSSCTPKKANDIYLAYRRVNEYLDQIVSLLKSGHIAKKAPPAVRASGPHRAPSIKAPKKRT